MMRRVMDPNVQVRRATIEDLPQLTALWQQENLPTAELEKRFKEFQLVQAPEGTILGAIGLQVSGTQARLHSEALLHPEQGDELRAKLWERTRLIAGNFGIARIWLHSSAPFWRTTGFQPAGSDDLAKFPPEFGDSQGWQVLKLREEAVAVSIDKEFAMFREAERERTEKMFRQAKVLKMVAAVVAVGVFLLVIVWAFIFFTKYRGLPK
jgi:N-acetylglutamate synthase-like GNAT family acetyltransferase